MIRTRIAPDTGLHLAAFPIMKRVSKVLIGITATGLAGLGVFSGIRRLRAWRKASAPEIVHAAGVMNVGAVDEVELSAGIARQTRGDMNPESYDPEEVPSEHAEINDLRGKMPLG